MSRRGKEFSAKTKVQAWIRSGGRCEYCGVLIRYGPKYVRSGAQFDHEIAIGNGGDNSLKNCKVACRACHDEKTPQDVKSIAKGKRVHRKHINATAPKQRIPSRGFPKREKESKRWPGPTA